MLHEMTSRHTLGSYQTGHDLCSPTERCAPKGQKWICLMKVCGLGKYKLVIKNEFITVQNGPPDVLESARDVTLAS